MRRLAVILSTVALLAAGAAIAVAGGSGSTHHGNAGHDQYHPKPGCGPWKSGGYAGGSGYHFGQPPKDHHRRDCPKPPCDRYSHFSSFATGSSHHDDDCDDDCRRSYGSFTTGGSSHHGDDCDDDCDRHRYSGNGYGGHGSHGNDCRRSSERGSAVVPASAA
jgi:hypothetical protein